MIDRRLGFFVIVGCLAFGCDRGSDNLGEQTPPVSETERVDEQPAPSHGDSGESPSADEQADEPASAQRSSREAVQNAPDDRVAVATDTPTGEPTREVYAIDRPNQNEPIEVQVLVPAGWVRNEHVRSLTFEPSERPANWRESSNMSVSARCQGSCFADAIRDNVLQTIEGAKNTMAHPNFNTGDPELDAVRANVEILEESEQAPGRWLLSARVTYPEGLPNADLYQPHIRIICYLHRPDDRFFVETAFRVPLTAESELPALYESCRATDVIDPPSILEAEAVDHPIWGPYDRAAEARALQGEWLVRDRLNQPPERWSFTGEHVTVTRPNGDVREGTFDLPTPGKLVFEYDQGRTRSNLAYAHNGDAIYLTSRYPVWSGAVVGSRYVAVVENGLVAYDGETCRYHASSWGGYAEDGTEVPCRIDELDGQPVFHYSLPEDGGLLDDPGRMLFIEGSALVSASLRDYRIERPQSDPEGSAQGIGTP